MGLSGPHVIDNRYAIYDEIASGGMATVHFGCSLAAESLPRVVAIKRLHAHLAREPEFLTMFLDEARLATRIRHKNVAPTFDVVATDRELFLIMEYVHGESLSRLFSAMRAQLDPMPLHVAAAVVCDLLRGLQAAHEATDERGASLQMVHRDVSPHNVIVGGDGVTRIVDFGIAKAAGRLQRTLTGQIKGKFGYMAPEQVNGARATRASDLYAAGVVLWESLTGATLHTAETELQLAAKVLLGRVPPPSHVVQGVPIVFDDIVMRALDRDPARRFSSAGDMATAIESSLPVATPSEVADWVHRLAGPVLRRRREKLAQIESDWSRGSKSVDERASTDAREGREARGDSSTRAVTYEAIAEASGGFDRVRRRRSSALSDTADEENAVRRRRSRALGGWIAIAVAAGLAGATLIDRRSSVDGWFVRAATTEPAATTRQAAQSAPSTVVAPAQSTRTPEPSPAAAAPIEAAPPTIPVETLPRAAEPPPSDVSPKTRGVRARPHRP